MFTSLTTFAAIITASPAANLSESTPIDPLVMKILGIIAAAAAVAVGVTAFKMYTGSDKGDVKKDMNRFASVMLATATMAVAFMLGAFVLFAFGVFDFVLA